MLKISLLLEKLAAEHSATREETDTVTKLRAFVDGVCDTVNLLLVRFMTEINERPIDDLDVSEWDIITKDGVQAAESTSAQIFGQLLETVRAYDDNRADRRFWINTGVHKVQWFALHTMAFSTFAAVAFIDANSALFEIMLCFATVLGIVVMSLLVADQDRPFHGYMYIRLDCVLDVIHLLDNTCLRHSQTSLGKQRVSIIASDEVPRWGPPDENSLFGDSSGSPEVSSPRWEALKRKAKGNRADDYLAQQVRERLRSDGGKLGVLQSIPQGTYNDANGQVTDDLEALEAEVLGGRPGSLLTE